MAADPGEGPFLRLDGPKCFLRRWARTDVPSLVRHANNLNVARHLRDRFPHPYTRAHAFAFLTHAAASDTPTNLAIVVAEEAVGGIGYVRGSDVERYSAEVGYWLGEELWGRGIATEALQMLTQHLFSGEQLLRLFALPLADNAGSIRVLEKAGYAREGLLRASCVKYGERRDQLLYARINPDWNGAVRDPHESS
jgi:[ribosomal protein S5]-alanine N-acetyltransferase